MSSDIRIRHNWKKGARVILLAAVTSSTGACSYFFKDTPKSMAPVEVKAAEDVGACLSGSIEVMTRYLKKDADRKKADEIIDCALRSISLFTDNTRGEKDGVYTAAELKAFIQRYFVKDSEVPAEMMPILFRLKASLYGGSDQNVTRGELMAIRKTVESFKWVSQELDPFRDIYSLSARLDRTDPAQMDRLNAALEKFVQVAERFGHGFGGLHHQPFAMKDFATLLKLSGGVSDHISELERYADLGASLKSVLIRPPKDSIDAIDWPLVFEKGARAYGFYLRYRYSLEKSSIMNPHDLREYEVVGREVITLLRSAVGMHESGRIGVAEWDAVVDSLERLSAIPFKLKGASLKEVLRPLFSKVLHPEMPPLAAATDENNGLTANGIMLFETELLNWIAGHRAVLEASVHAARSRANPDEVITADIERSNNLRDVVKVLAAPAERNLDAGDFSSPETRAVVRARQELVELLSRGRVLAWDKEGRLLVVPRTESALVSGRDLVVLNAIRAGVGVVLRSYAKDPKRVEALAGITEDEEQEFYLDVRAAGVDIGLLDPRVRNAGARSFMEANIFTSVADGNSLVNLHEGVEFFALILSGGRVADRITQESVKECGVGEKDIFSIPKLGVDCFRRHMVENFGSYFANLPGMAVYAEGLRGDAKKWAELQETLEIASRPSGASEELVENADLRTMVPILHYAESTLVNFDINRDGTLQANEIWAGFPRFKEFIRRMGQGKAENEAIQKTIFSYLLTFGRPPSKTWLSQAGLLGWHVAGRHVWSESASRLDVLKVIASLNVFSRAGRVSKVEDFFNRLGSQTLERGFRSGDEKILAEAVELFGCPPDARADFSRLASGRAKSIFASDLGLKLTSEKFIANLSHEIKADPRLARVCQPLM